MTATGSLNEAIGVAALFNNTTAFGNVAIGHDAMLNNGSEQNTVVGTGASANITLTGFGSNIYIGAGAGGTSDEVAFSPIGARTIKGFPYDHSSSLPACDRVSIQGAIALRMWLE